MFSLGGMVTFGRPRRGCYFDVLSECESGEECEIYVRVVCRFFEVFCSCIRR